MDVYLAHVHCPALTFTVWGRFAAVHLAAGQQARRVLIGRTFLRGMVLVYDGTTGNVQICC